MAVKVTGVPLGVVGVAGLMLIPVSTAVATDRLAVGEVMPFSEAVTVVVPTAMPVATPVVLLIVATPVFAVAQVTWLVMLAVVLSVYVPVAVKLVVRPLVTEAEVGLIAIVVNIGAVTINVTLLEVTPFADAVTVVLPTAAPEATPVVLLIVAIPVLPDAQFTWLVMLAVEASESVPVAMKLVVSPLLTVFVAGVIAMLASVTGVGVELLLPPPHADSTSEIRYSAL